MLRQKHLRLLHQLLFGEGLMVTRVVKGSRAIRRRPGSKAQPCLLE
jgi:hypothetical protein